MKILSNLKDLVYNFDTYAIKSLKWCLLFYDQTTNKNVFKR